MSNTQLYSLIKEMTALAHPLFFFSGSTTVTTPAENRLRFLDLMDFFFVAHPASGRKEGFEHKRIMFYSPKHETVDKQTDVTGFAEAVTNFTDNFVDVKETRSEFPFRTVSTRKSEQIYVMVENSEYMIGTSLLKHNCSGSEYAIISQAVCTVVRDAYKMFRLFFGTFENMRKKNEEEFRERLEYFFSRYLHTLKLHKMPLLDWLEGVVFLPLDKKIYLRIVTLMDELVEEFPQIERIVVLYQDKLLYYTVSVADLPSLFRYLTQNLLPSSIETELEPRTSGHGRFLRGPQDLALDRPLIGEDALPIVHLHTPGQQEDESVLTPYHMMAYRILNATVCMFAKADVTSRMLRNIDGFLGTDMSSMASDIGEYIGIHNNDSRSYIDFHYIYFNPSSLSLTSSFEGNFGSRICQPPLEVTRLLCESMRTFMKESQEFGECFVKSANEWWIVLKKANSRLLCLMIPPTNTQQSLADIQVRSVGIIKSHFESIFLN